jgi:hypothetical protein
MRLLAPARIEPADTRDVVPTLAAMLAVPAPAGRGNCLAGVSTVVCPKR